MSRYGSYSEQSDVSTILSKIMIAFFVLLIIGFGGLRLYKGIMFSKECGGHIKRAADANRIPLAIEELEIVVKYLEDHGMKEGYTSVIYNTPSEDVGFWHRNLSDALKSLKAVPKNTSPYEESMVLIKLRETLLDHGQTITVTAPRGISVFPYNGEYAVGGIILILISLGGIGLMLWRMGSDITLIEVLIAIAIVGILLAIIIERA